MKLTVLGSGDSAGVPQVGCDCPTCRRYGEEGMERTRFSVLLENDGKKILVDASPDLRTQMLREGIEDLDAVIFTHAHYDHYGGFGSLYRVIWHELPVFGTPEVLENVVEERYSYLPFPKTRGVKPYEPFEFAGLEFEFVTVSHPPIDSYGVVVRDGGDVGAGDVGAGDVGAGDVGAEDVGAGNDCSAGDDDTTTVDGGTKVVISGDTALDIPEKSTERMRNPDLLVADAFIPAEGEFPEFVENRISDEGTDFADKHMTYKGACNLVEDLDADRSVFVHLSHYYRDEREFLGWDGWSWES